MDQNLLNKSTFKCQNCKVRIFCIFRKILKWGPIGRGWILIFVGNHPQGCKHFMLSQIIFDFVCAYLIWKFSTRPETCSNPFDLCEFLGVLTREKFRYLHRLSEWIPLRIITQNPSLNLKFYFILIQFRIVVAFFSFFCEIFSQFYCVDSW